MKKLTVILSTIFFITLLGLSMRRGLVPEAQASGSIPQTVTCASEACQQMQAQILKSTVRVHLQVWRVKADESGYDLDESVGHATLREDRSLVTHNHYALLQQIDLPDAAISVVLYDNQGQRLFSAPLTDYNITLEGAETLVLAMKSDYDWQRLAAAGITPASFSDWQSVDLQPGMTVAQVDWDGQSSRVDWVTVEKIVTNDGVPRLILSDGVTGGGSGGGVFYDGRHIANNWQSHERLDGQGNILYATSIVSLNN